MSDWQEAEQRVEKAQEFFAQQKWQEALDELRAAISINPYNGAWYFNLGLTLDELHRFSEAAEAYRRALQIEGDDVESLHRLAVDQARLGQLHESLKTLDKIASIDSSFEPAYCVRIRVYHLLGDHDKAEETFYLARQIKDECPRCYFNMGASLADRRLFDKAIYCWRRALDFDDGISDVHALIARAYSEKNQLEQARQHFLLELRTNPGNTDALLDLGDLLVRMGSMDEAGEKFRRAIELAPEEPSTYLRYGRWLLACSRLDASRESVTRALNMDPRCPGAHLCLAEICRREGDLHTARRHLRVELRLRPSEPRILMDLANLMLDCDQPRLAAATLKYLVSLNRDDPRAWHNLAVAQFLAGHFEQGLNSSARALNLDSAMTSAMFNLALAYLRHGDPATALCWIQNAMLANSHDPAVQRLELRIRLRLAWNWMKKRLGF